MGNPAGVKRDFVALEKRRFEAVRLLEKSALNQSEVACRVHVCRQTVSRWAEEFRAGGREALKKAGPGRKPEGGGSETPRGMAARRPGEAGLGNPALDLRAGGASDRQRVRRRVSSRPCLEDPGRSGLEWSASGRTSARAEGGRDPPLAARTLARPKKKAQKEGRTILFIDESGISQRPHRVRTWSPCGETPVLPYRFHGDTLSAVAGIPFYNFYFRLYQGSVNSPAMRPH